MFKSILPFTLFLFLAACTSGCKNVVPVELINLPEPPAPTAKPKERPEAIAWSSKKTPLSDTPKPLDAISKAVSKPQNVEKHRHPTPAGKLAIPKKESSGQSTSTMQPASVPLTGIPRDVWYILATIFGAVFTSILGPIVVEIIRERMAFARQQQVGKEENGKC